MTLIKWQNICKENAVAAPKRSNTEVCASTWCTFTANFSTRAVMSGHSLVAQMVSFCTANRSFSIVLATPQSICHHPWVSVEEECWPFLLFSDIWTQLDGFQLCTLTLSTLSLNIFCDSPCRTPYITLPFSMYPYKMVGTINEESVSFFIFW